MYKKIKHYIARKAIINAEDILEKVKIEILFSIIIFYIIVYIIGSIPVFMGHFIVLEIIQIIGFLFIVAMAITLKMTNGYKTPSIIWFISGIVFTASGSLVINGEASFILMSFLMMNVAITFLILDGIYRLLSLVYYFTYAAITISITHELIPHIDIGIDFSKERVFFNEPNVYAVIIAMSMLSFVVYSFVEAHKKASKIIFEKQQKAIAQEKIILTKNTSIVNSIEYAVKIQESFSVPVDKISKEFPDHFILLNPKDKLSGDFYWMSRSNDLLYFSVIDCTGHGIPGAMISIVGRNGLEKAINKINLASPAEILDFLSKHVEKTLNHGPRRDGMDMSLCSYDPKTKTLIYAGANNPIYIIRNGKLLEHKAQRQPVGKYDKRTPFENQHINLKTNDQIYLFSDGYADQFGGENGKKLKAKGFKELLISISQFDMTNQKKSINSHFLEWKGNLEQVDDICIMGIKV